MRLPVLLALLGLAGCRESLYAPAPNRVPCGSDDAPCAFRCNLDCASTTVEMAAACMQSLQGTFDSDRRRCEFPDGGRVLFSWPVPAAGSDLAARSWKIQIRRAEGHCLSVTAQPLPWVGGGFDSVTEVSAGGRTYRQELQMTEPGGDGGLGISPAQVVVDCPDGRRFRGEGPTVCADCPQGDCLNLPLVELSSRWSGSNLDFQLRVREQVTPLFSCR